MSLVLGLGTLASNYISIREVPLRTGVNYSPLLHMRLGQVPSPGLCEVVLGDLAIAARPVRKYWSLSRKH